MQFSWLRLGHCPASSTKACGLREGKAGSLTKRKTAWTDLSLQTSLSHPAKLKSPPQGSFELGQAQAGLLEMAQGNPKTGRLGSLRKQGSRPTLSWNCFPPLLCAMPSLAFQGQQGCQPQDLPEEPGSSKTFSSASLGLCGSFFKFSKEDLIGRFRCGAHAQPNQLGESRWRQGRE